MTDLVNACFELGASIFLTLDCQALRKDRRVAGISVISRVFFVAWGLFNPYFYVVQGLTYSFIAGLVVCAVNLWWLGQYWIIKREEQKKELMDRINRVINTEAFEEELNDFGYSLFEFQATWHKYKSFKAMPIPYKTAILAGEKALFGPQLIDLRGGAKINGKGEIKTLPNSTVYDD